MDNMEVTAPSPDMKRMEVRLFKRSDMKHMKVYGRVGYEST